MPKVKSGSDFYGRNDSLESNKIPYRRNFQKLNEIDNSSDLIANNGSKLFENRSHVLNGLAELPLHSGHDMYEDKLNTLAYVSGLHSPLPNKEIANEFSNSNMTLDEEINTFYDSVKSSGVSMKKIGGRYSKPFKKLLVERMRSKEIGSKKTSSKFNMEIARRFNINKTTLDDWKYSNIENTATTVALGRLINRLLDNYDRKEFLYRGAEKNTPNLKEMGEFIGRNRKYFINMGNPRKVSSILNIRRKYYEEILQLTRPVEDFNEDERIKYEFINKLFEEFCNDGHPNKMGMPATEEKMAQNFISNKKEKLWPLNNHYLIAHFCKVSPGLVNYHLNDGNGKKKVANNTK